MAAILCLAFICSFLEAVPLSCIEQFDHEQEKGEDFTDTGVGCIDDCLEPANE